MSTYAQQTDIENFIEGWVTDDPFALERLIRRCEHSIDRIVVPINFELPPSQVIAISGASGGTFAVDWNGLATPQEPFNVSTAQLQTDLINLPGVGLNQSGDPNVHVLGTPASGVWTIIWDRSWAQTNWPGYLVPQVTVDTSHLTGPNVSYTVSVVKGRKINPVTDIDINQQIGLSHAVAAQVEFRSAMGERFFVRPQYPSVKGPDFTTTGRLSHVAPKARGELAQVGLLMTGARAVAGMGRRGVARGWPNY